jgi:hypothetical protein
MENHASNHIAVGRLHPFPPLQAKAKAKAASLKAGKETPRVSPFQK